MTSQQTLGTGKCQEGGKSKTSFINYENTFGTFGFRVPTTNSAFVPVFETATVSDPNGGAKRTFVSVSFASSFNGSSICRKSLNVVIALDISGSMGWSFDNDDISSTSTSKLEVAKTCMKAIISKLNPNDRIGIVLFNHEQSTMESLKLVSDVDMADLLRRIDRLSSQGGTCLQKGFEAGMRALEKCKEVVESIDGANSRVIFMTDMESNSHDEKGVLHRAKHYASKRRFHTTVVGIGVDLSVGTVEGLSSIAGCRYTSVSNASEFQSTVASDFDYDVTPIAFDINLSVRNAARAGQRGHTKYSSRRSASTSSARNVSFKKGFGSPELHWLKAGERKIVLSSEFASPMTDEQRRTSSDATSSWTQRLFHWIGGGGGSKSEAREDTNTSSFESGIVMGGLLLFELENASDAIEIKTSWTDPEGMQRSEKQMVRVMQSSHPTGAFSGENIRKAIALVRYVDMQSAYVLDDQDDEKSAEEIHSVLKLDALARRRGEWVQKFTALRTYLQKELQAVGDTTLTTSNRAIEETIQQILDIETGEIKKIQALREERVKLASLPIEKRRSIDGPAPREFYCPITGDLMKEPVLAADGHSYEKDAIQKWMTECARNGRTVRSPMTNKRLLNTNVIDNIALRKMIQDYRDHTTKKRKRNRPTVQSNVSVRRRKVRRVAPQRARRARVRRKSR